MRWPQKHRNTENTWKLGTALTQQILVCSCRCSSKEKFCASAFLWQADRSHQTQPPDTGARCRSD